MFNDLTSIQRGRKAFLLVGIATVLTACGEFSDATLQGLYDYLTAQGSASRVDALVVGATIEDLDIIDLQRQLEVVDNQDVTVVFECLQKSSRNHLRAFHASLTNMAVVYTPVYISQLAYDEIVNSPMEGRRSISEPGFSFQSIDQEYTT